MNQKRVQATLIIIIPLTYTGDMGSHSYNNVTSYTYIWRHQQLQDMSVSEIIEESRMFNSCTVRVV